MDKEIEMGPGIHRRFAGGEHVSCTKLLAIIEVGDLGISATTSNIFSW